MLPSRSGETFAPMELKPSIFKPMVYKHLIPTGLGHVYSPILLNILLASNKILPSAMAGEA
jgi:hypothetical protein